MTQPSLTQLLRSARDGDSDAANRAFRLIFDELHRAAGRQLARRGPRGQTLTPTALVNEAWIKLAAARFEINDRGHFLAMASTAMRQIVVDAARARLSDKRGGDVVRVTLTEAESSDALDVNVLKLEEALQRLEKIEPRLAQVVQYRYFAGLTEAEVGEVLELTDRTVRRDWRKARAFLHAALTEAS